MKIWIVNKVFMMPFALALLASISSEPTRDGPPQLSVRRVYADEAYAYPGSSVIMTEDCVNMQNIGRTDATAFRVELAPVNPSGSSSASPLTILVDAPLKPDAVSVYCHDYGYPQRSRKGDYLAGVVTYARFADGHVWFASPPYAGRALGVATDPVDTTNVAAYLPSFECADIKNSAAKSITHAQIMFLHYGGNGQVIDQDALDINAKLDPGDTRARNCRDLKISSSHDVFFYANSNFSATAAPNILYEGSRLQLAAEVMAVDFQDGTHWRRATRS